MENTQIAKIIRFHRKKSGLSQTELAKLAGIGKTVVFDIEKGKISIRFDSLLKVLDVLNIKIEFSSPLMNLFTESINKIAKIYVNGVLCGELQELGRGNKYRFVYNDNYQGPSVSLTMPTSKSIYEYDSFPPFFEGLLPEGMMLEGLLRQSKLDQNDLMSQLIAVGGDLVGNVTVRENVSRY